MKDKHFLLCNYYNFFFEIQFNHIISQTYQTINNISQKADYIRYIDNIPYAILYFYLGLKYRIEHCSVIFETNKCSIRSVLVNNLEFL